MLFGLNIPFCAYYVHISKKTLSLNADGQGTKTDDWQRVIMRVHTVHIAQLS